MKTVTLLVKPASGLCNMRCKYCFYTDEMAHRACASHGIMREAVLDAMLRRAFDAAEKSLNIAFQGGEPTLAGLDFFKKVHELTQKYNTKKIEVNLSIQTNGYDISREMAELFAKEKYLVGVSIDGYSELHDMHRVNADGKGTFSRVKKTVKLLEACGVEYNILTVITAAAARSGRKIYRSLTQAGFRHIQFIACLDPLTGDGGKYSLTSDRYGRFLCDTFDCYFEDFAKGNYVSIRDFDNLVYRAAGLPVENCAMVGRCGGYFTVEADGDTYPCDFYVLDEWLMGNMLENALEEMATCETAKRFIEISEHVEEECRACRHYILCRGGCRRNRDVDGELQKNRFCEAYKLFYDYATPRLVQMARSIRKS